MIAKEIYQKPEIMSVALKVSGFFAAKQDYDPDEVAKALEAAGLSDGNTKSIMDINIPPIDIGS